MACTGTTPPMHCNQWGSISGGPNSKRDPTGRHQEKALLSVGSQLWNSLPQEAHVAPSLPVLHRLAKTGGPSSGVRHGLEICILCGFLICLYLVFIFCRTAFIACCELP